jgi:hypothetical protein
MPTNSKYDLLEDKVAERAYVLLIERLAEERAQRVAERTGDLEALVERGNGPALLRETERRQFPRAA